MGTGTGLMAVVMGIQGATDVMASDISERAVANARENIENFNLKNAKAVQGDLFESVSGTFDLIVFNHPFFGDTAPEGDTIAASMLNSGELISRFLGEVSEFLAPDGIIMMPFYTKAGEINDPALQGPKFGFQVETTFKAVSTTGLQTGEITIHELTRK